MSDLKKRSKILVNRQIKDETKVSPYNKQLLVLFLRQLRNCGTDGELSQRELARRIGCSFASIQNWEDSDKSIFPDEYNLQKIANYAVWDIDDLKRKLKGQAPKHQLTLQQILSWIRTCEPEEAVEINLAAAQRLAKPRPLNGRLIQYQASAIEVSRSR